MLRRIGGCISACLAAVMLASGCNSPAAQAPKPTPTKSSAASKSPSPSADPALDAARAKKAAIPIGVARQLGLGSPKTDAAEKVPSRPTAACVSVSATPLASHAYNRKWVTADKWVSQTAFVLLRASPLTAIQEWRVLIPHCKPYRGERTTYTYVRDVQLPSGPSFRGVEAQYAFCERLTDSRGTLFMCTAFLARGNMLTRLHVVDWEDSRSARSSEVLLSVMAAAAAEALAAA